MTSFVGAVSFSAAAPRVRRLSQSLALAVFVGALGYLVLVPLVRLQIVALEDGALGYRDAYTTPNIGKTLRTTIAFAVGSLSIAMVFGTALAYAATRLPERLRLLRILPILPIVVPALASVTGWSFLLSPRPGYLNALLRHLPRWNDLSAGPVDVYTVPWITIITGVSLSAFIYLFVSSGLQNINREMIEGARIHGSSSLGAFVRITLPLLKPVLLYGAGVALLLGLGQFVAPLLLGRTSGISVLTTDMFHAVGQTPPQYARAAALGSPLILFGGAVVLLQRWLVGDQARFVSHTGGAFRAIARPSKAAAGFIVVFTFVTTALPILALVGVSLSPFWSSDIDVSKFTAENFRNVFQDAQVTDAMRNGVIVSTITVLIALPVGFIAASVLLNRRRHRMARVLTDVIVSLPLSIPAVIFGVGFLLTYTNPPLVLYNSRWVIILVYVTLMLPFTARMQLSGMVTLGTSYIEASRASGAGSVMTSLRIVLPLMRSSIGGAAALMFVLLSYEFAASILVSGPTTQVMGTALFNYYTNGYYPQVACIALIMTLVTTIGVAIAVALGGSKMLDSL